jgi:hypothetical protein
METGLKLETLMTGWAVNSHSDKTFVWMAEAYQVASQWAEKNLTQPFYIEPDHFVQYEIDEHDPMAIHFISPISLRSHLKMVRITANRRL